MFIKINLNLQRLQKVCISLWHKILGGREVNGTELGRDIKVDPNPNHLPLTNAQTFKYG